MPAFRFVNGNAFTTSVNNQNTSDTVITPASNTGFPSAPQFTILERQTGELMLVTAVGATWTVVRGYGGTPASPIVAGDNLDYSVTREMLLGGFVAKLDEQTLSADTPTGVVTLTVPTGLPFLAALKIRLQCGSTGDNYMQMRFNNDSSLAYDNNYAYFGTSSSSGQWNSLSYGRFWTGNQALPQIGCDADIEIGGADNTDRWKTWNIRQWLRQSGGQQYVMLFSGAWKPAVQAAISTIQFSCDTGSNGVWAAGTLRAGLRACLYGVP